MDNREQSADPLYYGDTFSPNEYQDSGSGDYICEHGFTKFEECAMRFHQAILSGDAAMRPGPTPENAAKDAIDHAKAFFDELEKREEKKEVEESLK